LMVLFGSDGTVEEPSPTAAPWLADEDAFESIRTAVRDPKK
jgi:hypothetical protein